MSFVLSPLQQQWLQEIQVPSAFLAPYKPKDVPAEKIEKPSISIRPAKVTKTTVDAAAALHTVSVQPIADADLAQMDLAQLQAHVEQCQGCELHQSRTQTVWGAGQQQRSEWFVVSTAPSSNEELAGIPMQGKSGELFVAQMQSIGINTAEQMYITQLLKCRVDKAAEPQHINACKAILFRQIELVQPQRLLLLGSKAVSLFLGSAQSFDELRGQVQQWGSLPVIVSYHPASLLLRPQLKAQAWDDLLLMRNLFTVA